MVNRGISNSLALYVEQWNSYIYDYKNSTTGGFRRRCLWSCEVFTNFPSIISWCWGSYFLNMFAGTAGDSLSRYRGQALSTKNQDNDSWSSNCAVTYKGAWWYYACHTSNLNGLCHHGPHFSFADGVNWNAWKGHKYSAKRAETKIRPVHFQNLSLWHFLLHWKRSKKNYQNEVNDWIKIVETNFKILCLHIVIGKKFKARLVISSPS